MNEKVGLFLWKEKNELFWIIHQIKKVNEYEKYSFTFILLFINVVHNLLRYGLVFQTFLRID